MILLPDNPVDYQWETVGQMIKNAAQIALDIAGLIAAIYLIVGAFYYFTAYGDEAKATTAKNTILYAIIGVVLILLSKVIIGWVWTFVTNEPLTF